MTQKEYHRRWYKKNTKKVKARSRAWFKKNKKRHQDTAKQWYKKNRERQKASCRRWYKKNKKKARATSRAWYYKNRKHALALSGRWYRKNIKKSKAYDLNRSYGISLEDFSALKKAQNNRCAICQKRFQKTPFVDHCHEKGKVRGLLCITCNMGLGAYHDSIPTLKNAINYLRRAK